MKKAAWILAIVALAAGLWGRETVKIGAVLPMSGNNGYLGQSAREGLQLRLSEVPSDSRFSYQLIVEDNEFVPAKTNLAARKLRDLDKVDVMLSLWGYGYSIVMPVIKDRQIVHLSLDAWTDPYGHPYDFVLGASYSDYAKKMAEAVAAVGAKRAVFFAVASPNEKSYARVLRQALEARGVELLDEYYTNFDVRDFRTYILKIRELKPDIFISTAQMPMIEIALKQMKELGWQPMIAGASANFLEVTDKKLLEGAFYVLTPTPPVWFVEKFKAKYGREPAYPAANGYDTLSILIDACEKLPADKKPTPEAISNEIRKVKNFAGALGDTSFRPPNQLPSPVVCYQIRQGQPVELTPTQLGEYFHKKVTSSDE